jgi:biopolymer transport protein ExbD
MKFRPSVTRAKRRAAQVEMTSLVDVVFLLLIFLLVSTTFKKPTHAFSVPLPKAGTVQVVVERDVPVVFVHQEGTVSFLDAKAPNIPPSNLDYAQLERRLVEFLRLNPEGSVRIRAQKDTSIQHVIRAMDVAKRVGIPKVLLEADREKNAPETNVTPTPP